MQKSLFSFSINKKIFLGFLAVLFLSCLMALVGFLNLTAIRAVSSQLEPFAAEREHAVTALGSLDSLEKHLEQYLVVGGDEYKSGIEDDIASFNKEILALSEVSEERTGIESAATTGSLLKQHIDILLSPDTLGNAHDFNEDLRGTYDVIADARKIMSGVSEHLDARFSARVAQVRTITDVVLREFFFLELLIIFLGVVISLLVARNITAPIRKLNAAADRISAGDYHARADVDRADEIGELAGSFNTMAEHLSRYTEELEQQVAARTSELATKVEALKVANTELDKNQALLLKRDAELTSANDKLRELDKAKSEFLSVAAHQLRTPLSAIKWVFSILGEEHMGKLTDEQKSYLLKGEESNNRMIRLVDDMLTVTRIESGKVEYHFYFLSLDDVLRELISDFKPRADEYKQELVYVPAGNVSTETMVDPEKIRFVFENLLENAIKYTPRGGRIDVVLSRDGEMLKVAVKDNGIGIPEAEQKNIFAKFFRAANAVKTVTDGTGLGLFVARVIIEKHGGSVSFESALGKGTTFTVTLPVTTAENKDSLAALALAKTESKL